MLAAIGLVLVALSILTDSPYPGLRRRDRRGAPAALVRQLAARPMVIVHRPRRRYLLLGVPLASTARAALGVWSIPATAAVALVVFVVVEQPGMAAGRRAGARARAPRSSRRLRRFHVAARTDDALPADPQGRRLSVSTDRPMPAGVAPRGIDGQGAMVSSGPPDPLPRRTPTTTAAPLFAAGACAGAPRTATPRRRAPERRREVAADIRPRADRRRVRGRVLREPGRAGRHAPLLPDRQSDHFYGTVWGDGEGAEAWFVYPPPFAYIVRGLSFGGWGEWLVVWTVILAVSFSVVRWVGVAAVVVGFGLRLFVENFKPISEPANHLTIGNLQPLILAAVVLGLRYPAMWAIPLLTKIGPGIGILWFVVRREWRSLGIALGTTAAIVVVSLVIDPGAWGDGSGSCSRTSRRRARCRSSRSPAGSGSRSRSR